MERLAIKLRAFARRVQANISERLVVNTDPRDPMIVWLDRGICPECKGDTFLGGPGALNTSKTIECVNCGADYVVGPMDRNMHKHGPLLWANRLPGRYRSGNHPKRSIWRAMAMGAAAPATLFALQKTHLISIQTWLYCNLAMVVVAIAGMIVVTVQMKRLQRQMYATLLGIWTVLLLYDRMHQSNHDRTY